MRLLSISCVILVFAFGGLGHAQDAPTAPPSAAPGEGREVPDPVPAPETPATAQEGEDEDDPREPAQVPPDAILLPPAREGGIPSPGELSDRLVGDLPEPEAKNGWTAPAPILTLHGYLRVRGELMDTFWLGRAPVDRVFEADRMLNPDLNLAAFGPDPFTRFRPLERSVPGLDCAGEGVVSDPYYVGQVCDVDTLQFANTRFRLSPQINLSEDVRIKTTFDILDNYVLGQAPASFYGSGNIANSAFPSTNVPNGNTIVARRAWAEVSNRDLGELRFGLMPQHWGLGMLYNSGDRLDDDFSTDLGRVMGITNIEGFYITAAYDFIAEGVLGQTAEFRPAYDGSQIDDVDQFTFSVARRLPNEEEEAVLERGDPLLNLGLQLTLRNQDAMLSFGPMGQPVFERLSATYYTPDLWAQLRYRGLRVELEAAWVVGSLRNPRDNLTYDINQLGAALETELRLLDDHLGIYFNTGFASGDSDVEGLSSYSNFIDQIPAGTRTDRTISTFRFHPTYRVDMILWRNILRQVTGAYYFKPGISYDFVRNDFGQLFGARLDFIWSRAAAPIQAPGNAADLGIELNAQIYWRSDDGPNLDDGYHAALQYGVLFPMQGLGYYHRSTDLSTAQTLRLILGVMF